MCSKDDIRILIACEESQAITTKFRERGFVCFSCDLQECSGGHPEWHIKGDCLPLISGGKVFTTMDGKVHKINSWDLIIAHPECTYLTVTGNRWFNVSRYGEKAKQRHKNRDAAAEFFMQFVGASARCIAIENPIGYMSTFYRKPDQIIQPYQYGDATRKSTCLWLKNLPRLTPTNIVEPVVVQYKNGKGTDSEWHMKTIGLPPAERARERSKTFPGIASAIAEQWGDFLVNGIDANDVSLF